MKLFTAGRKGVMSTLKSKIKDEDKTIWFHCASLGEFEQGLPIMEAVKKMYADHKLVVTFFSPSGFEVKKNSPVADIISYLPLDTSKNARDFIRFLHPSIAVFVKYEFWPNYLFELKKSHITTLLVSGLLRPNHSFFKWYGGFLRKSLNAFDHFFVQDNRSKDLLQKINFNNVTVSGDTRFDRVSIQFEMDNSLGFVDKFKRDSICIVCGSTWPEDELVLLDYINSTSKKVKFIIAPHEIEISKIEELREKLDKKSILFSELPEEMTAEDFSEYSVMIIDTIGLLTKIYSYADISYVGGAMGNSGLHNILEAATFGIPVVIGENFERFPEAIRLRQMGGLFSISNAKEGIEILSKLQNDSVFRNKSGMIAGHFVNNNTGATRIIMEYLGDLKNESAIF